MNNDAYSFSYPIGEYRAPEPVTAEHLETWIEEIARLPEAFRRAVSDLDDAQLDTPYRDGGWTVRQLTHHVPDSHLNCYVRFKWALTEDEPMIKAYDEKAWARLRDSEGPIEPSLRLLAAVHERWVSLLRSLSPQQLTRVFHHPDSGPQRLDATVGSYAWHGRHHLAHVTELRQRRGW